MSFLRKSVFMTVPSPPGFGRHPLSWSVGAWLTRNLCRFLWRGVGGRCRRGCAGGRLVGDPPPSRPCGVLLLFRLRCSGARALFPCVFCLPPPRHGEGDRWVGLPWGRSCGLPVYALGAYRWEGTKVGLYRNPSCHDPWSHGMEKGTALFGGARDPRRDFASGDQPLGWRPALPSRGLFCFGVVSAVFCLWAVAGGGGRRG